MGRIVHMCLDIEGALRWPRRRLAGLLLREDGSRATAEEAWSFLRERLKNGDRVLPMGECEGFDSVKGCPGHEPKGGT